MGVEINRTGQKLKNIKLTWRQGACESAAIDTGIKFDFFVTWFKRSAS